MEAHNASVFLLAARHLRLAGLRDLWELALITINGRKCGLFLSGLTDWKLVLEPLRLPSFEFRLSRIPLRGTRFFLLEAFVAIEGADFGLGRF